jgi:type II secretory pathway component PulJ
MDLDRIEHLGTSGPAAARSTAWRAPRDRPCGVSLLEMLVTIALGLFLVGATAGLLTSQLAEHRRVLLDTRVTQELRAVLDLVARDVRRAGYWGHAADAAARPASAPANPYDGLHPPATAPDSRIGYAYSRDTVEDDAVANSERFGLRLNSSNRSADWRMSGSAVTPVDTDTWQALTDPNLLRVTRVSVSSRDDTLDLLERCANPSCPLGSTTCPPRLLQRLVDIEVEGVASADPTLRRRLSARVTLRNPALSGACPSV